MLALSRILRATVRGMLWLTVAISTTWVVLWIFEELVQAGVFGFRMLASNAFWVAGIVVALAAGNALAYCCDRALTRWRARPTPLGQH